MKDDLWAKRTINLYVSFVLIYLQILIASYLTRRKDLMSKPLENRDVGPMDPKKQKTSERPGPSNKAKEKEKEVEGAKVDADLDASLGNLLRQMLEREKKLKEDVKRATKQEMEAVAKLKQGNPKELEESKRLMEENKHLQIQIQSVNKQMQKEQIDMQRALEEAMKSNANLKRKKNQLDYREQ